MTDHEPPPADLAPLPASVVAIGGPLTPDQLDTTERLTRLRDDSWVIHEAINVWRGQSDSERKLRKLYANAMLIALCMEITFASAMFILIGASVLTVSPWVANVFFGAVFTQVATGALGITKYLFPPGKTDQLFAGVLRLRELMSERKRSTRRRGGKS